MTAPTKRSKPLLSQREKQVAEAYSGGQSYKEIAQEFGVAPTTIRTHLQSIYRKLNVSSKVELLRRLTDNTKNQAVDSSTNNLSASIAALPPQPIILALPFRNLSNQEGTDHFAEGLSEDICGRVSLLRGIRVKSQFTNFQHDVEFDNIQKICRELGATHVLDGSVRTASGRVRVNVRVTDGQSGTILWSRKYDRKITKIFEVQDEITHSIVVALQVEMADGSMEKQVGGTDNHDAWEFFHRGAIAHLKYTPDDTLKARELFLAAMAHDPKYIDARIFHAWTYWQNARSGFASEPEQEFFHSRQLLNELLSEGIDSANLRHFEAATLLMERNFTQAIVVARSAVSKGPSKLFGNTPSALTLAYSGNLDEAIGTLKESIRLIPHTPNDIVYNLAWMYSLSGEHNKAIGYAQEYLKRVPSDLFAYVVLALCSYRSGQSLEAEQAVTQLRELYPNYRTSDYLDHEPFADETILDEFGSALIKSGLPQ